MFHDRIDWYSIVTFAGFSIKLSQFRYAGGRFYCTVNEKQYQTTIKIIAIKFVWAFDKMNSVLLEKNHCLVPSPCNMKVSLLIVRGLRKTNTDSAVHWLVKNIYKSQLNATNRMPMDQLVPNSPLPVRYHFPEMIHAATNCTACRLNSIALEHVSSVWYLQLSTQCHHK